MVKLKGITVLLTVKTEVGKDPFNAPIYEEHQIEVANVLVAPASGTDITTSIDLYGKKAVYTLGLPKGNTDKWEDTVVEFFGHKWRTFGPVTMGIESLVPTQWHKKVMVERYE